MSTYCSIDSSIAVVEFGEIFRCKSYGEPHISTWHSDSNLSPTLTTCTGNRDLKYVQNKYIDMDVNIRNGYNVAVSFLSPFRTYLFHLVPC